MIKIAVVNGVVAIVNAAVFLVWGRELSLWLAVLGAVVAALCVFAYLIWGDEA
jgi:hypothetical protein